MPKHLGDKISAVFLSALMVAGALVMSARATIGEGGHLETNAPDLVSAELSGSTVTYCFDETVDEDELDEDGDGFLVVAYDDELVLEGDDADDDDDDEECVEVKFDDDFRPARGTVAYVEGGTVEDHTGNRNQVAAVELTGSSVAAVEGMTTAPDLEDFDVDEAADQVAFEFDDRIDQTRAMSAGDFGVHQDNGDEFTGDSIVSTSSDTVVVQFSEDLNASTERAFSEQGVVATEEIDGGDQSESPFGQVGDDTDDPDIDDVSRSGDEVIRFDFDEDIDEDTAEDEADLFYAIAEDGSVYEGDDADAGSTKVEVEFSELDEAGDFEIVAAGVAPGAVESDSGSAPNTAGVLPLSTSAIAKGLTDAPDVEQASLVGATAKLTFDESVGTATPSKFFLVDDDGVTTVATGIALGGAVNTGATTVDSETVSVVFPTAALTDAVGVVLASSAATDHLSNNSSPSSVALGAGTTTTSTSTSITTTTTSTTPPPTPPCERDGVIEGTDASDVINGTGKSDVICALGGNDFVRGRGGNDTIYLGDGDDIGEGGGGKDRIFGEAGNDILRGGGGADTLDGGDGTDTLLGQGGRDTCTGGERGRVRGRKAKSC